MRDARNNPRPASGALECVTRREYDDVPVTRSRCRRNGESSENCSSETPTGDKESGRDAADSRSSTRKRCLAHTRGARARAQKGREEAFKRE